MTEHEIHELLIDHYIWLKASCRRLARTRPGLSAGDLLSDVVEAYLVDAADWFQQAPTTSREAQARDLLRWRLLNIITRWDRRQSRSVRRFAREQSTEEEFTPLIERISAEHGSGPGFQDPLRHGEANQISEETAAGYLAQIRSLINPVYRYLLLAVYYPDKLQLEDVEACETYKQSGAKPLKRAAVEVFQLLEHFNAAGMAEGKLADWKKCVAFATRLQTPLRGFSKVDWEKDASAGKARGWLNRTLYRARVACFGKVVP